MACDSIDVPAWVRIWLRVKETISCAMSVSRMRDSDADRFSTATLRLLMVCSKRFWKEHAGEVMWTTCPYCGGRSYPD